MNYELICHKVVDLSKLVGNYIKEQQQIIKSDNIESKSNHDFVTYVDKTSEQMLVKGLSDILPESGFIVEENTSDKKGEVYNWIVDPLDGTTNFINKISPFAISIALVENKETVMGVVYEISLDECFCAYKGSKAFLNGKEIKVSSKSNFSNSLIATGFPFQDYSRINNYLESLKFFMLETSGIRRLGSAATDLAYIACGRFDAFYEYSLKPWDVAAGAFIVEQAGGVVSEFNGGYNYVNNRTIIAANPNLYKKVLDKLQVLFKIEKN